MTDIKQYPICERCQQHHVIDWKWNHGPCVCYSCANSPWMNEPCDDWQGDVDESVLDSVGVPFSGTENKNRARV